jgi:hypothetical protein
MYNNNYNYYNNNNNNNNNQNISDSDFSDNLSLFSSLTRSDYIPTPSSELSDQTVGVVQDTARTVELEPTTTKVCKRRKWSTDMNIFILRTYLQVTNLDTNTKQYLDILFYKFTHKFPNFNVSKQRLGDQRRAIVRNRLLPQSVIDNIYTEVQYELNTTTPTLTSQPTIQTQTQSRLRWTNEGHHDLDVPRLLKS